MTRKSAVAKSDLKQMAVQQERKHLEMAMLFQLRSAGLPKPVVQHRFHPDRKWTFDIAWPTARVAVECEGGRWIQGRHVRGDGFHNDCIKYAEAICMGWKVLRFTAEMIEDGTALHYIECVLTG